MYGRPQNHTKLRRAFRCKFFAQTDQMKFWQIEIGNFCAKQTNFAQTGHTRRRAGLCVAASQAYSLSTCCEWQKRDRAKLSFVILYRTGFIAQSRFCHSQHVLKESACSAATHRSARRRVWPVYAKFVCFAQKIACFCLPKFPLACLRKICGGMPSSTLYSSVADQLYSRRLRNPGRFTLDKQRIGPEMSNRAVGIGCIYNSHSYARQKLR